MVERCHSVTVSRCVGLEKEVKVEVKMEVGVKQRGDKECGRGRGGDWDPEGVEEEEDDLESLLDDAANCITPTPSSYSAPSVSLTPTHSFTTNAVESSRSEERCAQAETSSPEGGGDNAFDPLGLDVMRRKNKKKRKSKGKSKDFNLPPEDHLINTNLTRNGSEELKRDDTEDNRSVHEGVIRSPHTPTTGGMNDSEDNVQSLVKQLRQIQNDALTPGSAPAANSTVCGAGNDDTGNSLPDDAVGDEQEMLSRMLEQLMSTANMDSGAGQSDGTNSGNFGDIRALADAMMTQMLSKEILQKPMTEIRDKYPPWLEANGSSLSAPERERYTQQYRYVCEVCRLYDEDKGDDGGGSETRTKIMDVLQRMQECGQPPQELIESLAPGALDAQDGIMSNASLSDSMFNGLFGAPGSQDDLSQGVQQCPLQ